MIGRYLRSNLGRGLSTSPLPTPLRAWILVPLFVVVAMTVGFGTDLLRFAPLQSEIAPLLPFTLFIFPSLLEEMFFRGVLIPRETLSAGRRGATRAVVLSSLAFVAWHPINALAFNHSAIPVFLDPWFLVIVVALGVTCGHAYVVSRSVWVPVIIHWATVSVWVLFLGGRNLVLEL